MRWADHLQDLQHARTKVTLHYQTSATQKTLGQGDLKHPEQFPLRGHSLLGASQQPASRARLTRSHRASLQRASRDPASAGVLPMWLSQEDCRAGKMGNPSLLLAIAANFAPTRRGQSAGAVAGRCLVLRAGFLLHSTASSTCIQITHRVLRPRK